MWLKYSIFIIFIVFVIYSIINLTNIKEGSLTITDSCPVPLIATNPDEHIFDTLVINDFITYMDGLVQQTNADLDNMDSLVKNGNFNIIVDDNLLPDVEPTSNMPIPIITMDSSDPPNYSLLFKLPRGRQGQRGKKGKDGDTGPTGPTGPIGEIGNSGKWVLRP